MDISNIIELAKTASGYLSVAALMPKNNDDYQSSIEQEWVKWSNSGAIAGYGSLTKQFLTTETDVLTASSNRKSVVAGLKLLEEQIKAANIEQLDVKFDSQVEELRNDLFSKKRISHKAGNDGYLKWMYMNNSRKEISSISLSTVYYYKSLNGAISISGYLTTDETAIFHKFPKEHSDIQEIKMMLPDCAFVGSNQQYKQAVFVNNIKPNGNSIRRSIFHGVKKFFGFAGEASDLKYHKGGAKVQVSRLRATIAWAYVVIAIFLSVSAGAFNWAGRTKFYEKVMDVFQLAALLLVSVFGLVKLTSDDDSAIRHILMGEYIMTTPAQVMRYLGVFNEHDMCTLYSVNGEQRSIFVDDGNCLVNYERKSGNIDGGAPIRVEAAVNAGAIMSDSYIVTASDKLGSLVNRGEFLHIVKESQDVAWWMKLEGMSIGK